MTAPTVVPGPPAPAPRPAPTPTAPTAVFVAGYLLCGAAALWLSAAIATLYAIPHYQRYYGDRAQDADAGRLAGLLLGVAVVTAVLGVGVALLLALSDARGSAGGRVLTWIFAGVAGCVSGAVLLLDLFAAVAWHRWLMTGTALLTLGFVLATSVLLALPRSTGYVRAVRQARVERRAALRLARQAAGRTLRYAPPPRPYPTPGPYAQPYRWPGHPGHQPPGPVQPPNPLAPPKSPSAPGAAPPAPPATAAAPAAPAEPPVPSAEPPAAPSGPTSPAANTDG